MKLFSIDKVKIGFALADVLKLDPDRLFACQDKIGSGCFGDENGTISFRQK